MLNVLNETNKENSNKSLKKWWKMITAQQPGFYTYPKYKSMSKKETNYSWFVQLINNK